MNIKAAFQDTLSMAMQKKDSNCSLHVRFKLHILEEIKEKVKVEKGNSVYYTSDLVDGSHSKTSSEGFKVMRK